MAYETALAISQLTAMAIFSAVLIGVVIYVFRPSNKQRFERAARMPLDNDNELK
jgi:cytochrome c oxidase cbb3-type subunit IV